MRFMQGPLMPVAVGAAAFSAAAGRGGLERTGDVFRARLTGGRTEEEQAGDELDLTTIRMRGAASYRKLHGGMTRFEFNQQQAEKTAAQERVQSTSREEYYTTLERGAAAGTLGVGDTMNLERLRAQRAAASEGGVSSAEVAMLMPSTGRGGRGMQGGGGGVGGGGGGVDSTVTVKFDATDPKLLEALLSDPKNREVLRNAFIQMTQQDRALPAFG